MRVVYYPRGIAPWRPMSILHLEADINYNVAFYDPITGSRTDLGVVNSDATSARPVPQPPVMHDWLLVLEATPSRTSPPTK